MSIQFDYFYGNEADTIYILQNTENTCNFPHFQTSVGQCKAVIWSYA